MRIKLWLQLFEILIFMEEKKSEWTAFILVGGKSSRMGMDKATIKISHQTFVERITEQLNIYIKEVVLVSSKKAYSEFGLPVIYDIIPNKGPLGAICTALTYSKTNNNLIISCDTPLINTTILKKLMIETTEKDDVVQLASTKKTMPLVATYKKHLAPYFQQHLKDDKLKLQKLISSLQSTKTIPLSPQEEKYLLNINSIEELREAMVILHL